MEKLQKFQNDLIDDVSSGLLGTEHLVKDVKELLGVNLDSKYAHEIRNATLDHFSLLTKKAMKKADEDYNEQLEQLERLKEEQMHTPTNSQASNSSIDLNESYQDVTWPDRRDLLLEYEKILRDSCSKLEADLDQENVALSKIVDGMKLDK